MTRMSGIRWYIYIVPEDFHVSQVESIWSLEKIQNCQRFVLTAEAFALVLINKSSHSTSLIKFSNLLAYLLEKMSLLSFACFYFNLFPTLSATEFPNVLELCRYLYQCSYPVHGHQPALSLLKVPAHVKPYSMNDDLEVEAVGAARRDFL